MDYLERNRRLFEEIGRTAKIKIGSEIGRGTTSSVNSLGRYNSETLGRDVYLALKKIDVDHKIHDVVVSKELGMIRAIERRFPHLLVELPLLHGLLIDENGAELGVLTEDFSQGSKYGVFSMHESDNLPLELREAFGYKMDKDDLATTCFLVSGSRRIGDFGELSMSVPMREWETQFPYEDIYTRLKDFTVTLR